MGNYLNLVYDKNSYPLIYRSIRLARGLLCIPDITAAAIVDLGYAIDALEHLPEFTNNFNNRFGVGIMEGNSIGFQKRVWCITITGESFSVSCKDSAYHNDVCLEKHINYEYKVGLNNYYSTEGDITIFGEDLDDVISQGGWEYFVKSE
ncbi:MAG: hypothetical protein KDH98_08905 [Calditrichaeota bacterium]|nr:hypothetical protein [Calditrichota bacterium]